MLGKNSPLSYFVFSYIIVFFLSILIIIVIIIHIYKKHIDDIRAQTNIIARQSALDLDVYARLFHSSEMSIKRSIQANFYSGVFNNTIKKDISNKKGIYGVIVLDKNHQIIASYPEYLDASILEKIHCSTNSTEVSQAFVVHKRLTVVDCIPFQYGFIVITRVPVLELITPIIKTNFNSIELFMLKPDGTVQDSFKKMDYFHNYIRYAKNAQGSFTAYGKLVSYAKIPYTKRTLFVTLSEKEIFFSLMKTILPILIIVILSFILFSAILVWIFYRLSFLEKQMKISFSFTKLSSDINTTMIEKRSFYVLIDKAAQVMIQNDYIELVMFCFKEKDEIKLKSYKTKERCNVYSQDIKSSLQESVNQFLSKTTLIETPKIESFKKRSKHNILFNECLFKAIGYFPIISKDNTIGVMLIATKYDQVFHPYVLNIINQIISNLIVKIDLINFERRDYINKQKVMYFAYHDTLTGLVNRGFFNERIKQSLAKLQRLSLNLAIFEMDLDGFKRINDTYGHDMGDLMLKAVAKKLKCVIREEDTLSRFGGDEFLILTDNFSKKQELESLAFRILDNFQKPFYINGKFLKIGISIGIAYVIGKTNANTDDFLKLADECLYVSKNSGKNTYTIKEIEH